MMRPETEPTESLTGSRLYGRRLQRELPFIFIYLKKAHSQNIAS